MAMTAGWVSLICTLVVVGVALAIGLGARTAHAEGGASIRRARPYYFALLLATIVVGLVVFLGRTPYTAHMEVAPAASVDVVSKMWAWELKPSGGAAAPAGPLVLPAGKVVEFNVTSVDVNHGFGIYDETGMLVAQTQAMPGYVNHLRHVFDAPGRYRVVCMEYCGVIHHMMITELSVR